MAVIEVAPLVMKDVTAVIGGTDDFKKHLSSVVFTPTASQITWTGLGSNTFTDTSLALWTVALTFAQDWETVNSLSQYLYEHEGETVTMEFHPKSGSGPSFTANVTITPGAIGGAVNAVAEATATLGCDRPVLVPAV